MIEITVCILAVAVIWACWANHQNTQTVKILLDIISLMQKQINELARRQKNNER